MSALASQSSPRTNGSENPARWRGWGYVAAAAGVGVAFGLRLALDPLWGDRIPYVPFVLAVFALAQFAGTGPAVLAMIAGFLVADWFFVPPRHSLLIADTLNQVNAVLYFFICSVVVFLSHRARKALVSERAANLKLAAALAEVRTLTGLLPICSHCKKIRDDKGDWNQIEFYIREHSNANFTHSICPECSQKHYPEIFNRAGS